VTPLTWAILGYLTGGGLLIYVLDETKPVTWPRITAATLAACLCLASTAVLALTG
jgi:hypothetical protein